MSAPIACTALCLLGLIVTLWASVLGWRRGRYTAKPLASLGFILVALTGGALTGDVPHYGGWIVAGLVLGAVGDVALMLPGRRPFFVGLVAFLLGHVAYAIAFLGASSKAPGFGPLAVVPIVVAGSALYWLWPHLDRMRFPVMAYVLVITCMVAAALGLFVDNARPALSDHQALLACVGAVLFFVSDLAVARERFVRASLYNRLWGLPAYYIGQLLIAWSAL